MERYKSRFNEATLELIKTSKGYVLEDEDLVMLGTEDLLAIISQLKKEINRRKKR